MSSLLVQACEEIRVFAIDQSCLCDQELGRLKKRPRRSGASADEDRHEHFTRSNVAYLRVSCGLPATVGVTCPLLATHVSDITQALVHPAVMPQYSVRRWYGVPWKVWSSCTSL